MELWWRRPLALAYTSSMVVGAPHSASVLCAIAAPLQVLICGGVMSVIHTTVWLKYLCPLVKFCVITQLSSKPHFELSSALILFPLTDGVDQLFTREHQKSL